MIYNNEEYKEIPGYHGYYASASGSIYSSKRHRLLSPQVQLNGYIFYAVRVGGVRHSLKAHRAVALAWLPNPEGKPEVHHKDEDKTNNSVENLAWVTAKENNNAGTRISRFISSMSKPVVLTSIKTGEKLYFKSGMDARRAGYSVEKVMSDHYSNKTTKGYTVEWDDHDKYL